MVTSSGGPASRGAGPSSANAKPARIVVLCDLADLAALWAARGLSARGYGVEVISAPLLASALSWEHRLGHEPASLAITLHGGRRLTSDQPIAVLNRLTVVPRERLDAVAGPDRDYALQELQAFFLSWLHALPGPVVNRPSPQALSGHWRHPSQWSLLAAEAGLATAPYRQASSDPPELAAAWPHPQKAPGGRTTVLVVGERVIPQADGVPESTLDCCLRLRQLAGETILGVDLALSNGIWTLAGVSLTPNLSLGGEPVLNALESVLRQ